MKNLLWVLFILDTFILPVKSDTKAAVPTIPDTKADTATNAKAAVTTVPDTKADTATNAKAAVTTVPDTIAANTKREVTTVPETISANKETVTNIENRKATDPTLEKSTFADIFNEKLFDEEEDITADGVIAANTKATTNTGAGIKMDNKSGGVIFEEIFDDKADTKADGTTETGTKATATTVPGKKVTADTIGDTKLDVNTVADTKTADTTLESTKATDTSLEDRNTATNTEAVTNAGVTTLEQHVPHPLDDDILDDKEDTKDTIFTPATVSDTKATGTTLEDSAVADIDAEDTTVGEIVTIWPREVFCTDDASLFRVSADQSVSAAIEGRLQIYRFEDGKMMVVMHPHLKYPIIPSVSPAVLSENKQVVMLPDLEEKESSIGIEMPDDTINIFFKLIHDPPQTNLEDVVEIKADTLAAKLLHKAETWKGAMDKKAATILQAGPPAPPGKHPILRKSAQYAKTASQKVMQVTKFTAGMVGQAVEKLGETVRHDHTNPNTEDMQVYEEITSDESNSDQSSSSNLFKSPKKKETNIDKAVVEVLATTHVNQAWGKLSEALEKASEMLTKSLKENTVKVVRHKYGDDVGEAVKDLITSVKNTNEVRKHIKSMRVDKITGRTFKRVFIGPTEEKAKKPPPPGQCTDEL